MEHQKEAWLQELRDRTPKSGAYWETAKNLVPGGLMSGARKMEPYPVYVERGKGAYVWDIDGNRYIDYRRNSAGFLSLCGRGNES